MAESVPRFSNGDRKYPSHFEFEKRGWIRGEPPTRIYQYCGKRCEWWSPDRGENWTLFNLRSTESHNVTCTSKSNVASDIKNARKLLRME